ncbi:MAG TPA: hypothetical protein PLF32_07025 [Bacteroidales bacterium]|jgi:hypothetical protein|nr:hypothetical protein [Bacteroidales bacterium]HOF16376.1 hypothetical protein [Bacteroidales bacterium]HOR82392.1 hypothetical protein [Bacteroidales bacterium]HPJ91623.1 hypothetical protein [Bacteroidales bacterium]HPX58953.1 hypothetical protein [Bacteroidales bacterium]
METWWSSMDIMQQIAWAIAISTSLIFIVQMIMTFVGMDSNVDFSAEVGDSSVTELTSTPFQLFTFRNFINFFLGFSWSYIVFDGLIDSKFWVILISVFVGIFLVLGVMFIFYGLSKMVESGNISIHQSVGLTATVYIPIQGNMEGKGKVQVSIQNSVREYDAITKGEALKTGTIVKIKEVVEGNILCVEKL